MAELTPDLATTLSDLAGFRIAEGQVEKRAAQVSRQIQQFEAVRTLPLGTAPPATPWIRPEEG